MLFHILYKKNNSIPANKLIANIKIRIIVKQKLISTPFFHPSGGRNELKEIFGLHHYYQTTSFYCNHVTKFKSYSMFF